MSGTTRRHILKQQRLFQTRSREREESAFPAYIIYTSYLGLPAVLNELRQMPCFRLAGAFRMHPTGFLIPYGFPESPVTLSNF